MTTEQTLKTVMQHRTDWITGNGFADGTHEAPIVCTDYHVVMDGIRYDIRQTYAPTAAEIARFREIDDLADLGYAEERMTYRIMWSDEDGDHEECPG